MEKKCGRCGQIKNYAEFNKDAHTVTGKTNRCRSCISDIGKERHKKCRESPEKWDKILNSRKIWRINNLERKLLNAARNRAAKKGIAFDLDLTDVIIPEVCPALGIPIKKKLGKGDYNNVPSLDRVDNSKGYVKGNVRVISWRANTLKKDGTVDEFKQLIRYMEKELNT